MRCLSLLCLGRRSHLMFNQITSGDLLGAINNVIIRPIPAVLILKCRRSRIVSGDLLGAIWNLLRFIWKHPIVSLVVLSIVLAAPISILFNHLVGVAVLVCIVLFGLLLKMFIGSESSGKFSITWFPLMA